jgi:hypothetical protein
MHPPPSTYAHTLWAITAYFNPEHFRSRLANYRIFRRHLALPLLTVELSFDGVYELTPSEADVLVQRQGGDVMWQKERLLNIALDALPPACRNVLWTDCDILFEPDDLSALEHTLADFPIVQPFQQHHYGPQHASESDMRNPSRSLLTRPSLAFAVSSGRSPTECLARPASRRDGGPSTGVAWAARRDVLARHGLYDRFIAGGGDRAIACAAYGCFNEVMDFCAFGPRQREHYLTWAEPWYDSIRGQVGCLPGAVFHLWHGSFADRRYARRHEELSRFHFDPYHDVCMDESGLLRWNSDKPDLQRFLREYFAGRKEDG